MDDAPEVVEPDAADADATAEVPAEVLDDLRSIKSAITDGVITAW